jgi:hypothetical protein
MQDGKSDATMSGSHPICIWRLARFLYTKPQGLWDWEKEGDLTTQNGAD